MSDDFVRPLLPPPFPFPRVPRFLRASRRNPPTRTAHGRVGFVAGRGERRGRTKRRRHWSTARSCLGGSGWRLFFFLFFFFFSFFSFFLSFLPFLLFLLGCCCVFFFFLFFCLQLKCSVPRSHRRTTTRPRRRPLRSRPTVAENTVYTYSTYFFSMLLEPGSAVVGLPLGRTDGRM